MDLIPDQIEGSDTFLNFAIGLCVVIIVGLAFKLLYENKKRD